MAQPQACCAAKAWRAAWTVSGSGVVSPVGRKVPASAALPGPIRPQPRVPIKPACGDAFAPQAVAKACASHQAVEVLPLVPVTAKTGNCPWVVPKKEAASEPSWACKPCSAATGTLAKSQAVAPSASTKQATAPRCSASATCRRASAAAPGQATKPSPGRTARLSLTSVPVTRACNQATASTELATRSIKSSRLRQQRRFAGAPRCRVARL